MSGLLQVFKILLFASVTALFFSCEKDESAQGLDQRDIKLYLNKVEHQSNQKLPFFIWTKLDKEDELWIRIPKKVKEGRLFDVSYIGMFTFNEMSGYSISTDIFYEYERQYAVMLLPNEKQSFVGAVLTPDTAYATDLVRNISEDDFNLIKDSIYIDFKNPNRPIFTWGADGEKRFNHYLFFLTDEHSNFITAVGVKQNRFQFYNQSDIYYSHTPEFKSPILLSGKKYTCLVFSLDANYKSYRQLRRSFEVN
jgi:hypothetical protein